MPHGQTDSTKATAQNATTESAEPNDKALGENVRLRPEAKAYVAGDFREASLAAPAAGEVGDYADLDTPSGGMAQGRSNTNREAHAHTEHQGPKTVKANREMSRSGSPDRGTT